MIPIAFIDDYAPLRNKISETLEKPPLIYQVHQYENGQDFVTRFPKENYIPGIVLMDIRMSPMNGYETTSWLTLNYPTIPRLAFSDINDLDAIMKISMCGAKGCTEKLFSSLTRFNEILECVMNGGNHYDSVFVHKMVKKYTHMNKEDIHEGFCSLTDKQIEILKLASDENTTEEKAKQLKITVPTFRKHISNIYEKLNINKASAMRNLARKFGLID